MSRFSIPAAAGSVLLALGIASCGGGSTVPKPDKGDAADVPADTPAEVPDACKPACQPGDCGDDGCGGSCKCVAPATCGGAGIPGKCGICAGGAECDIPGEPCSLATMDCTGGTPLCKATGKPAPDGKGCGDKLFCLAGKCSQCDAGAACPPAEPCLTGEIDCSKGTPECKATTTPVADGTQCGQDKVCKAGKCNACEADKPCQPAEKPCNQGKVACTTGEPVCDDSGAPAPNGTPCETDKVCQQGACVPCQTGGPCVPVDKPCSAGALDCSSGTPKCNATLDPAPDGTQCGPDKVCFQGVCNTCVAGAPCNPMSNPCNSGKVSCSTGQPMCEDQGSPATDGTPCGDSFVCKAGVCTACAAGTDCDNPAMPCHKGMIVCTSGDPVCTDSGMAAADGKACGEDKVCKAGLCQVCKAGAPCAVPGKPCQAGMTSCSTGAVACVEAGAPLPDGTACGAGQVCLGGECVSCVAGEDCKPEDPCAVGKVSCGTGAKTCKPAGPAPGMEGKACGMSGSGKCKDGACECGEAEVFFLGDCNTCPAFTGTTLFVNADAKTGLDNLCCGRSNIAGQLGGPCLTITRALKNLPAPGHVIVAKGDAWGNMSPQEEYPIHLGKSVTLSFDQSCLPGVEGKNVINVDVDTSQVSITYGTLGATCQGIPSGAADAVYVGPAAEGGSGAVNIGSTQIRKAAVGLHVVKAQAACTSVVFDGAVIGVRLDGGTVGLGFCEIKDAAETGVDCRSETEPEAVSKLDLNMSIIRPAGDRAVSAGRSCVMAAAYTSFGMQSGEPCPALKKGSGIRIASNAEVNLSSCSVRCFGKDGVDVLKGTIESGEPKVVFGMNVVAENGCTGLFAEAGSVKAFGNLVYMNHWGVVQHGSEALPAGVIDLTGQDQSGNLARNAFYCNSKKTPGACCTSEDCPNGFDVWNNSASPLVATGNTWEESPVILYKCDSKLGSCICAGVGADKCQLTPPDGTSVVNSPLTSGSPTTDTKNNALPDTPYACP